MYRPQTFNQTSRTQNYCLHVCDKGSNVLTVTADCTISVYVVVSFLCQPWWWQ